MWNRKELKEKAKIAFKANYWRCVLVALLMTLFAGVGSVASVYSNGASTLSNTRVNQNQAAVTVQTNIPASGTVAAPGAGANATAGSTNVAGAQQTQPTDPTANMTQQEKRALGAGILAVMGVLFAALFMVMVVHCILTIFAFNPLVVGLNAFFVDNAAQKVDLGSIKKGFSPSYMRNVGSMLLAEVFIFLWSMLFIVPGIIKMYSYRMVPYILAENPDMKAVDAITRSREMMDGNKWNAFVLDLSFLGWEILSVITFGIVGLFYVNPYMCQTNAELYRALKTK